MHAQSGQRLQSPGGFFGREGAVGIDAQLEALLGVAAAQLFDERHLVVPAVGPDLEFDAAEALQEFLLDLRQHLLGRRHPHEAVEGNALAAAGEGRVVEQRALTEIVDGTLQREEQRRVGAQELRVVVGSQSLAYEAGHSRERGIGVAVGGEVGQRRTLAQADATLVVGGGEQDDATLAVGAARSACGALEMEGAQREIDVHGRDLAIVSPGEKPQGTSGKSSQWGRRFSRKARPPSCASSSI